MSIHRVCDLLSVSVPRLFQDALQWSAITSPSTDARMDNITRDRRESHPLQVVTAQSLALDASAASFSSSASSSNKGSATALQYNTAEFAPLRRLLNTICHYFDEHLVCSAEQARHIHAAAHALHSSSAVVTKSWKESSFRRSFSLEDRLSDTEHNKDDDGSSNEERAYTYTIIEAVDVTAVVSCFRALQGAVPRPLLASIQVCAHSLLSWHILAVSVVYEGAPEQRADMLFCTFILQSCWCAHSIATDDGRAHRRSLSWEHLCLCVEAASASSASEVAQRLHSSSIIIASRWSRCCSIPARTIFLGYTENGLFVAVDKLCTQRFCLW